MNDRWWVVMDEKGYEITDDCRRVAEAVRGPFPTYDDALEYKAWWERKQMSRERMAAYIVILWVGFAMVVMASAAAEMIRGFFK